MLTRKSHPKRKHHELPELYLRGFSNESFLWIYERGKHYTPGIKKHRFNPYRCGVVEIAEKDRFAAVMPNGTRHFDLYENRLEQIEKKANNILGKIRSEELITSSEKEIFAEYIQNLYKRTKQREKKTRQILEKIQNSVQRNNIGLSFALNGQLEAARQYYEAQKYLESDDGGKTLALESMVTLYPRLHQTIKSMSWTFYVAATGNYFVTSSAPVAFDPVGLSVAPLLFPISKNIALIATHVEEPELEYKNTSSDETLMINFRTIVNAPNVYAPRAESWVWQILEHGLVMTEDRTSALKKLFPFGDGG